jgi:predicted ATP-grasp superfamily ATP-dependent carboligase
MNIRLKNLLVASGLTLLLPVTLVVVLVSLIARLIEVLVSKVVVEHKGHQQVGLKKTILISGGKMTKALTLARAFHAAGHRVILAETQRYASTGHRFSFAVSKFYTIPDPQDPNYTQALLSIIQKENVDEYVPVCSPLASFYDSYAIPPLAPFCRVVHVDPDNIVDLDDKYKFAKKAEQLGLRVPKTLLVTDPQQVVDFDFTDESRPFILKSIAYDAIRRLDLTRLPLETSEKTASFAKSLPISTDNPWILQEFIEGDEYCTHGTVIDGVLTVYCCCESSAFQINYSHVEQADIEEWVTHFVSAMEFTGQASFDFIRASDDGKCYAIECNPRAHSAITLFSNRPELAMANLSSTADFYPLKPLENCRPTYWLFHELWRFVSQLRSPRDALAVVKTILTGKDSVFNWRDPLPFLMLHHWHIPSLLVKDLQEQRGWLRIDFNIGKLVQEGGD